MRILKNQKQVLGAAIGLVLFLLSVIAWYGWQAHQWEAPGPATHDTVVMIGKGATLTAAAKQLEKQGLVEKSRRFVKLAQWFGADKPIKAGEYEIPRGSSMARILRLLQEGSTLLHKVTVVEGMSSAQVYDRLMGETMLTGQIEVPEEGTLLPETYTFSRGESRQALVNRMQAAMREALMAAWAKRKDGLPFKTPQEAVIMASIVEKETSKKSELREVSGVYINRLKRGMKLQADPTVIYPITQGKPLGRRIRKSELQAENDYNTYVIEGLPKGPIANPSRRTLEAVLNPAKTDNLFFVANGSGGHVFARTDEEHVRNVASWRRIRRERGI